MQTGDRGGRGAARSIRWRDRDHTRGSLGLSLRVLSLPPIGTSLAGAVVFQLFDLKFISYLGTVLAGLLALLGGVFPREILGLVGPAPDVLEAGVPYVRLTFMFSFGFIGVSIVSGILTGAGDTTTPMVIAIAASAISIVGEWCLVFGNLGAPGRGCGPGGRSASRSPLTPQCCGAPRQSVSCSATRSSGSSAMSRT